MEIRIPASDIRSVSKTYKNEEVKTARTATGKPEVSGETDSVVLSADARATLEVTRTAEAKARELPDVRERLVESLQDQVKSGQYQVEPEKVAAHMLADLFSGNGGE